MDWTPHLLPEVHQQSDHITTPCRPFSGLSKEIAVFARRSRFHHRPQVVSTPLLLRLSCLLWCCAYAVNDIFIFRQGMPPSQRRSPGVSLAGGMRYSVGDEPERMRQRLLANGDGFTTSYDNSARKGAIFSLNSFLFTLPSLGRKSHQGLPLLGTAFFSSILHQVCMSCIIPRRMIVQPR